jgi:hypothetical protein
VNPLSALRRRSSLLGLLAVIAAGLTAGILGIREDNTPTPYWSHDAIRLCLLGGFLAFVSIFLFAFGKGWKRIVGVTTASLLLVCFSALLKFGD